VKKQWTLYIVRHKGSPPGIGPTYAIAIHGEITGRDGGIQTVPYLSWQHLSAALIAVGVEDSELPDLKTELDRAARCHISEMFLDEADVRTLGFTLKQIPSIAFA
jgi:hypothetical protein